MNALQIAARLLRYGHAGGRPLAEVAGDLLNGKMDLADLVRGFQAWHGLAETGDPDHVADLLSAPRCGHPDVMAASSGPACQWPQLDVTYHQQIALAQLGPDRVAALYRQAWDFWGAVCGLRPREALPANVWARSGSGAADQFDAAGRILAWSQLPLGATVTSTMHQVFNTAESWDERMFLGVACHEIGHAIGLSHAPGDCLMNPYFNPAIVAPTLADAAAAQALYGPPAVAPADPSPPPAPVPAPDPGPAPVPPPGSQQLTFTAPGPGTYTLTLTLTRQP